MNKVAVAIGSNLGDRAAHLRLAAERLRRLLHDVRISTVYETEPVGVGEPQQPFLNAAAAGETDLEPRAVLERLMAIEREAGRERPYRFAPRTLDLDLILFGSRVIDEPDLVVPHPRFRERAFVLEPLAEVAADFLDPLTGKSVSELLALLRATPAREAGRRPAD